MRRDRIVFTRQLLTVYRSGIPLVAGLSMLAEQTENPNLRATLLALRVDVEGGSTLADAMSRHPIFFPEMYVSVIRAAEASGALEQLLGKLADSLESESRLVTEIKGQLRYPMFVVGALAFAFVVIVTFVLPRLQPLFDRFGSDLPLPTAILVALNNAVQKHGLEVAGAALALGVCIALWWRTPAAKALRDRVALKLPLVGRVYRKLLLARFAFTVGIVQRSGVPLLENLAISSRTVNNNVLAAAILDVQEAIGNGASLSSAMRQCPIFLPMVVHLAEVGEKSGQLDDMMEFVAQHFDEEVRYEVRNLTQLIEPLLTVVLGALVLGLALAIFLPYWRMLDALKR
ncbi:MAG: type II secretion system F family protein [Planctomycetes bacterium]|nr:type II secretion system F family protein [Planctomycetota bacterium]MBI3847959.1 type II secretion system F family protein [Planctomycetota bacterium]